MVLCENNVEFSSQYRVENSGSVCMIKRISWIWILILLLQIDVVSWIEIEIYMI